MYSYLLLLLFHDYWKKYDVLPIICTWELSTKESLIVHMGASLEIRADSELFFTFPDYIIDRCFIWTLSNSPANCYHR